LTQHHRRQTLSEEIALSSNEKRNAKRSAAQVPDMPNHYNSAALLRFLRLSEVMRRIGLSKSAIYARIAAGTFPSGVPLGGRAVGFVEYLVTQWAEQQILAARGVAQ